jgi:hypothetical protein
LPFEIEPSKEVPKVDEIGTPRCTFSDSLADSAFSRMKTEECRKKLEDMVCEMDPIGWPVHSINNTCPKFGMS